jgi:hypothetical protein
MTCQIDEKRNWLRQIVRKVLNQIEQNAGDHVVFVTLGRKRSQDIPLAEVKLDSRELTLKIRKLFAEKKKAGEDFEKVYITNSVTLATRVRIDIMQAIAKKFTTDETEFFVSAYSSRPIMHVRPKDTSQRPNAYTFSDAITRFGSDLVVSDLSDAYRRAGAAFKEQLQQNFVVLHDEQEGNVGGAARGPVDYCTMGGETNGQQKKRPGRWGQKAGGSKQQKNMRNVKMKPGQ